jgi:hypothetical protein
LLAFYFPPLVYRFTLPAGPWQPQGAGHPRQTSTLSCLKPYHTRSVLTRRLIPNLNSSPSPGRPITRKMGKGKPELSLSRRCPPRPTPARNGRRRAQGGGRKGSVRNGAKLSDFALFFYGSAQRRPPFSQEIQLVEGEPVASRSLS